jgi:hypothetical protein
MEPAGRGVSLYTRQATGLVREIGMSSNLALNISFISLPLAVLVATQAPYAFPGSNLIGIVIFTAPAALIDLIRGEFLAELRYEDWAVRVQTSVHAEVREPLLRLASRDKNADLAVRAACALLGLDPFDEAAQVALAAQLKVGGRPLAARLALARYARQLDDEELADAATPELTELMASLNLPNTPGIQ